MTETELPLDAKEVAKIAREIFDFVHDQGYRAGENISRVRNLIQLYEASGGKGRGRKSVHASDVLRGAVVLLHASLEDFLRSLAAAHLPKANAQVLDKIPLVGVGPRAEKFFLGKLVAHRGQTVEEVIQRSVDAYLERSNFNNTLEVAELLTALKIDIAQVNADFDKLDLLMQRRHQIVHRADRLEEKGRGQQRARSLSVKQVTEWVGAVDAFMSRTVTQLSGQQLREFLEARSS